MPSTGVALLQSCRLHPLDSSQEGLGRAEKLSCPQTPQQPHRPPAIPMCAPGFTVFLLESCYYLTLSTHPQAWPPKRGHDRDDRVILGLYRSCLGIMANKMETTIESVGFRAMRKTVVYFSCRPVINKTPPFTGFHTRIPIITPSKGRGFINHWFGLRT